MKFFLWFDNKIINCLNLNKKVILLIFIIFFGTILELVGLGSLIPLVHFLIKQEAPLNVNSIFGTNFDETILLVLFLITILVMIIIRFFSVIFLNYTIQKFLKNISFSLASMLTSIYLSSNFFYTSNNHSSLAIKNITSEVELYCKLFYSRLTIFSEMLILILIISILLFFYFKITIICVFLFSALFIIYQVLIKTHLKLYGIKREFSQKNLSKSLFEIFDNYKLIQIFNQRKFFIKNFNKYQKDFKDVNYRIAFLNSLPKNIFEFIFVVSLIFFLIYSLIYSEKLDDELLSIIITFSVAFYKILPSISKITLAVQSINFNSLSENIIIDTLNKNYTNPERVHQLDNVDKIFKTFIKVKNLSFNYAQSNNDEDNLLKNINFTIYKGSFTGISGPSGSGKTTLLNILMKFQDYTNGKIFIDNKNFNNIDKITWFSKISYVPQNVYIHNDTIRNNIIFGNQKINNDLFHKVMRQSGLREFVDQNNRKQEKILNEKGKNISAGQIQRLGIARALYKEPEIIFLDEPTSNLDFDNEQIIIETLKELTPQITVILISHKKSSLAKCDQIIKL